LAKLAVEASALTEEQFAALQPYYNWASTTWCDALLDATRRVGFLGTSARSMPLCSILRSF